MKKKFLWASLFLCALVALAVLVRLAAHRLPPLDIIPPVPPVDEVRETPPEPSLLSLSLVMEAGEVAALVEREIDVERYEDRDRALDVPFGEARADLVVVRDGPLAVRLEGGVVAVDLPLSFSSSVRWRGEVLGLRPSFTQEPSGSLVASVRLRPRLDGDGTLHLIPSVDLVWVSEPTMEIMGRSLAIGSLVERLVEGEMERRSEELGKRIDEALQTRSRLEDLWTRLHRPVELSSESPLWLRVEPERLYLEPLVVDSGRIELRAGLRSRLSVGTKRPDEGTPVPLPGDLSGPSPSDGVDLRVPLVVAYDVLQETVEENLSGKTFDLGNALRLSVKGLSLSGGGGLLFAALDVKGGKSLLGLEGTIYLRGSPVWSASEEALRLADFDYDENTTRGLARLAVSLLQSTLRERLSEKLFFPLGERLAEEREKLAAALSRTDLGEGFVLLTDLQTLAIDDVYASREGLRIDVRIGGKTKIVREGPL